MNAGENRRYQSGVMCTAGIREIYPDMTSSGSVCGMGARLTLQLCLKSQTKGCICSLALCSKQLALSISSFNSFMYKKRLLLKEKVTKW